MSLELSLLAALALPAADPSPAGQAPAAYRNVATVYDALGWPPVAGKRWVRTEVGPAGWWRQTVEGWLLHETPDGYDILDHEGTRQALRKPRAGEARRQLKDGESVSTADMNSPPFRTAWNFQLGNFPAFARRFLDVGPPQPDPGLQTFGNAEEALREGFAMDACRYAYWAGQRGEKRLALDLYVRAQKEGVRHWPAFMKQREIPLHEFAANRLAAGYRFEAIDDAHKGRPRPDVLKTWEAMARIPYHQHRDEARDMIRGYTALIAEDRAWKEPTPAARKAMTADQAVAYWLYHLRDADVQQFMFPGMCEVVQGPFFGSGNDKRPNPAAELARLGTAALPQVKAHLDDTRPTRCLGSWRFYHGSSYYLLRYGDCCQQIFEAITGHTIYDRKDSNGYPVKDGLAKACKTRAERWWRDYQRKGERQVLIEEVEAGGRDSSQHAQRLAEKYPDVALAPIIKGARRSQESWVRENLVRTAAGLKADGVVTFLREELKAPQPGVRVAAAWALANRRNAEGTAVVLRDWSAQAAEQDSSEDRSAREQCIHYLAHCGDVAAVRALTAGFRDRPELRPTIVEAFERVEKDSAGRPLTPAVQAAIEDLLGQAVADGTPVSTSRTELVGKTEKRVSDPALGDLAAEILVRRWARPGLFDVYARWGVRERQRAVVHNAWRAKRGRPPLPVPPAPKVDALPEARVRPVAEAVRRARTPGERKAALADLEALGLPGLPVARRLLGPPPANGRADGGVSLTLCGIAMTVAEVRFAPDSRPPPDGLRQHVESFRGKPMTASALMGLLHTLAGTLPPGARGIHLTLERPGDDTGASLTVTLVPDRPPRAGLAPQLEWHRKIVVDPQDEGLTHGGVAGVGQPVRLDAIDWSETAQKLAALLPPRPDQYLLVQIGCAEKR